MTKDEEAGEETARRIITRVMAITTTPDALYGAMLRETENTPMHDAVATDKELLLRILRVVIVSLLGVAEEQGRVSELIELLYTLFPANTIDRIRAARMYFKAYHEEIGIRNTPGLSEAVKALLIEFAEDEE